MNAFDKTLELTQDNWGSAVVMDFTDMTLSPNPGSPAVEVTGETTQDAALRFRGQRVCVLNFASGVNPGGGVRHGAKAQEEALCMCSGLLHGLETHLDYYKANRADDAPIDCYDRLIWSEGVPLIRDGYLNLTETMPIQVITYPAPNVWKREYIGGGEFVQRAGLQEAARATFERRCRHIVRRAANDGTEVLVLGAWGCGAYGNDPEIVAQAFKGALDEQSGSIKRVVFAIYTRKTEDHQNQQPFREAFGV
jgi:uncharacterized protein (TIGR02452 family)